MPARNPVERESPVIEQDGQGCIWLHCQDAGCPFAAPVRSCVIAGWPLLGRDICKRVLGPVESHLSSMRKVRKAAAKGFLPCLHAEGIRSGYRQLSHEGSDLMYPISLHLRHIHQPDKYLPDFQKRRLKLLHFHWCTSVHDLCILR